MGSNPIGTFPDHMLRHLCDAGCITADPSVIGPSSIDLTLTSEVYEINRVILPRENERVRDLFGLMGAVDHDLSRPLKTGRRYIARLRETFALPSECYGFTNPKSSTGRIDVHVRVLADGIPRYDSVPTAYVGELWLVIEPRSFAIKAHEGYALCQLRIFNGDTRFSRLDLELEMRRHPLIWLPGRDTPLTFADVKRYDNDGAVLTSLMFPLNGIVGYRCHAEGDQVLDLCDRNVPAQDFFKVLRADADGVLNLARRRFSILSTAEAVNVAPGLACEVASTDERSGEVRVHYAGFVDAGFGFGPDGTGTGKPVTLEVYPSEPTSIRPGQPVAKLKFERMALPPRVHYDTEERSSNYQVQDGPKLAKQFAPWPE